MGRPRFVTTSCTKPQRPPSSILVHTTSHAQMGIIAKSAESERYLHMHNARLNHVAGTQVNDPDYVNDVGHYLKQLPEQRSTTRAPIGVFDSVVMKNSEINHVTRNQINIGPQLPCHAPSENVKITHLSPKKGVFELVDSTANFVNDQINIRRPNA